MTAPRVGARPPSGLEAPYIYCEDLFKIYKSEELEVVALRGLDLRVARGEMMAIVGASGSGKSTLLNILAGLDTPSAGRVVVGDRDLLRIGEEELVAYRRAEVGFVWQQTGRNLIPYLNAAENVEVPQLLSGSGRRDAREHALVLLEQVGMIDRRGNRPEQLSGGEQQRVAIAVALANDPPLMLGDEPTGELDEATTAEVFQVFRRINQDTGVTVVIVTHDPAVTERVDRVVAMRDGRASSEFVRQRSFSREHSGPVEEFAVVDRSGRLQIPREYAERMGLGSRARLELVGEHVEVRSESAEDSPAALDSSIASMPSEPPSQPPEPADARPPEAPDSPGDSPWQRPT